MIIVNFAHPLREEQVARLGELCGATAARVLAVATQFDHGRTYAEQVVELVDAVGLSADAWQTERLVIVPPSLAAIACLVVAEIHGRAGYFVPIARLSPRANAVPPVFDVVEVIDLNGQREAARTRRGEHLPAEGPPSSNT